MKLKDPKLSPVGGWFYRYELTKGTLKFPATVYGSTFSNLIANVKKDMDVNQYPIPATLADDIEHQICLRQPEGRCWMQTGDTVANVIHSIARVIDNATGTKLEKKAKGCATCGKRRQTLNTMFS
jgi:hypothetical protein